MAWAISSLQRKADLVIGALLLLTGLAHAESPDAWASLHDGLLNQSMDRDPIAAIDSYEALLLGTPDGDPMRGDLLYWLGRARLASGDAAGAMETLGAAKKVWSSRSRSRALLGRLIAQKQAVRRLPHLQDFSGGTTAPWVRGWTRGRDGDLSIDDSGAGKVAAWNVEVRDGQWDFLSIAMDLDGAVAQEISVRLQATAFAAVVEFHLEDAAGRRWRSPVKRISAGTWTEVVLPLSVFVDRDAGVLGGTVDGQQLRWISMREVTAMHLEDRGENRLLIDDLSIR